jgi:hypothetical protein
MIFFFSMIFYTVHHYTGLKEVGSFVQYGLDQARSQNEHFINYFQGQLQEIEKDLIGFSFSSLANLTSQERLPSPGNNSTTLSDSAAAALQNNSSSE